MQGLPRNPMWTDGIRSDWSEPSCCTQQIEEAARSLAIPASRLGRKEHTSSWTVRVSCEIIVVLPAQQSFVWWASVHRGSFPSPHSPGWTQSNCKGAHPSHTHTLPSPPLACSSQASVEGLGGRLSLKFLIRFCVALDQDYSQNLMASRSFC